MIATIIFKVYLLAQALLLSSTIMHRDVCLDTSDKLYLIDFYAHYYYNVNDYNNFVNSKENCIFNFNNLSYWNITNISLNTTYDYNTVMQWSQGKGKVLMTN